MLNADLLTRERVTIGGPAGMLSAELVYPSSDPASHLVVVVNPHPLMGGTMQNNVVLAVAEALPCDGFATLRFDYRGVGDSDGGRADVEAAMAQFWQTGTAPQDEGLIDDAVCVSRWAARHAPLPLVLIGYSFGAYAAARVAAQVRAARLVLVAPTLCQHAFPCVASLDRPLFVVYGDNDFATPRETTEAWMAASTVRPQSLRLPDADHFFRGREASVSAACAAFIRSPLAGRASA